ncbi:MAG TPA: thioredoxin domain-containing protein [Chthoniobacterales bacterium]
MKRYAPFVIVALVALLSLAGGAMLYHAKRLPLPDTPKEGSLREGTEGGHIRGPANAPLTLEEFGDYECPPCGSLSAPLNQLEHDYRPRLRMIFRNFPLVMHPHARDAACAAEAAGLQGKFWEMHDLLYKEQSAWSRATDPRVLFSGYAGTLGLDVARFEKDRDGDQVKGRIAADEKRANALGVKTTPSIFINDKPVPSASFRPSALRATVDAAIKPVITP